MSERIPSFAAFWPYYVSQHLNPNCRRLHFVGTTCALAVFVAVLVTGKLGFLPLALVAGYGPAWVSHFFIEKNRPATFQYPLWSLFGDFVMYGKMWSGAMDAEVKKVRS